MQMLVRLRNSLPNVRNPSAFITAAVKDYKLMQGAGAGVAGALGAGAAVAPNLAGVGGDLGGQLQLALSAVGLDKSATDALLSLPTEDALAIVSSIDATIRNPSAWVINSVRNARERANLAARGSLGAPAFASPQLAAGDAAGTLTGVRRAASPGRDAVVQPEVKRQRSYKDAPWADWDLRRWLDEVDDGTGFMAEYHRIVSMNFDNVGQIADLYVRPDALGNPTVDDSFYKDVGVEKIGHRRLFERWFAAHLQS